MDIAKASQHCDAILDEIEQAIVVDREFLERVLTGVLANGHVLLEDVPGTGKTLTSRSLATTLGLDFKRIQFTPDLLPSDVTGSHIYEEGSGDFTFREGPIFSNVVLADEVNRAPPKTQAAMLEAMEEKQVTIEGETRELEEPFFVIATQNPIEQKGTFELPEAQRDRFMIKSSMDYPERAGEVKLLRRRADRRDRTPTVDPIIDATTLLEMQDLVEDVTVDGILQEYIVDLCRATREHESTELGVSPRGVQQLFEAARSRALIDGSDFVVPEHITEIAKSVLQHRIVLQTDSTVRGTQKTDIIDDVLDRVTVPGTVK